MKIYNNNVGLTIIEMLVAITIVSMILLGITGTFQSFARFNSWLVQFSQVQKTSFQDLLIIKESFEKNLKFSQTVPLALNIESVLAREKDSLLFHYLGAVKDSSGTQLSILDDRGNLALHNGAFFSGMVKVGSDLYQVDTGNHIIRKISLTLESEEIFVGAFGVPGDDDTDTQVGEYDSGNSSGSISPHFRNPTGIAYHNGKLYLSDTGNHVIRLIDISSKNVTTLAGNSGLAGNSEGPSTSAFFSYPTGIAVNDINGDIYISDTGNHLIKKISAGIVTSILGSGEAANSSNYEPDVVQYKKFSLNTPLQLTYDSQKSDLYINDFANKRILRMGDVGPVSKMTVKDAFYGGINIYDDPLSKRHLLVQNLLSSEIDQIATDDLSLIPFLAQGIFSGFNESDYIYYDFIAHNNDFIISGIKKSNNSSATLKLQASTSSAIIWYGDGGILSQTRIWDEKALIFNSFSDVLGKNLITEMKLRANPTNLNTNRRELLLKYFKKHESTGDAIEEKYSLILGE